MDELCTPLLFVAQRQVPIQMRMSSDGFLPLASAGIVAIITAYAYLVMWTDYEPMPLPLPKVLPGSLPSLYAKGMHVDDAKALSVDAKPSVTEISLSPLSDSS